MTVKILYLDDDSILTKLFYKKLCKNYQITTVNSYVDFANEIQDATPDIFILDLMMPDVSGLNIVKFLRNTPRFAFTPIIILSGVDRDLSLKECLSNGADDFMMKPPDYEELISRIDSLAERHKMNRNHVRQRKMKSMKLLINGFNHEFNNHLMILQGGLEILSNSINDPKHLSSLQSMQRTVQRATSLIRDISQLYTDGFMVVSSRNLDDLMDDFEDQICKELDFESVDFSVNREDKLDMFLQISDTNFFMVLKQIVTNSLEAFFNLEDSREPRIQLSICKDGELVEITVQDNGRGIAPQNLAYVFDPFYTTKGSLGGELIGDKRHCSGLGLSLAEAIADCSGGCISLQSKVGEGTRVVWTIPFAGNQKQQAQDYDPFFRMKRLNARPFRYLLAHNEAVSANYLRDYFCLQGCEIESVQAAEELTLTLDSQAFSLVIMHTGLGLDLVKDCVIKLRANEGKYFPIIILGNIEEQDELFEYCEKHNVKYLPSAVDLNELSNCISEIEIQMHHVEPDQL
tara:strand:+ start:1438 stop:2988 length:1551 start_codon:yes stop_codon:yes gene_type:complete